MKKEIVLKGDSVLIKIAKDIPLTKIHTDKIQETIKDLHDTLKEVSKGVGLAAPQIGKSLRVFVVAPKVFKDEAYKDLEPQTTYINPVITWRSKDSKKMEEGCLSIPGMIGLVKRSSRVNVDAYDINGNLFSVEAIGFLAQIFQHEIDHLDGILFDTKATNMRKVE